MTRSTGRCRDSGDAVAPRARGRIQIDPEKAVRFWERSFAHAADFAFFFVGNLDVDAILPELERTLGERRTRRFSVSLLLAIAYGASVGGMATLVGTAPNALLAAFMQESYGTEIDFASWMLVGLPLSALMLPLAE